MTTLSDVAEIVGGGTPSRTQAQYFGGNIKWATPTDVTRLNSLYIDQTKETLTQEGLKNSSSKLLPVGAVLLTSRATIGFVAVAMTPICTNQGFVNFVCGSKVEPDYLAYWLRSRKPLLERLANGATFKEISRGTVRKLEITVPDRMEQRRVVDLLSRAESIVRMRREAEAKAKEIIPALFVDMFGDSGLVGGGDQGESRRGEPHAANAGTGASQALVSAATGVAAGPRAQQHAGATRCQPVLSGAGQRSVTAVPFGSLGILDRGKSRHRPRDSAHLYGGSTPFIQTGDVAQSNGTIESFAQTYSEAGVAQSRVWKAGTLCITIAANIANTGVLSFDACFPDSVVGFMPGSRVRTEYIQEWLGFLRPTLEAQAPQAAQKNINLQILRNLQVPVPPLTEQDRFSERVASLRSCQRSSRRATVQAEQAFQSLLAMVFGNEQRHWA